MVVLEHWDKVKQNGTSLILRVFFVLVFTKYFFGILQKYIMGRNGGKCEKLHTLSYCISHL